MTKLLSIVLLLATLGWGQSATVRPQTDTFGGLTALPDTVMHPYDGNYGAWINTTMTAPANTTANTLNTITLANIGTVQQNDVLCIDCGAAPVQVTGELPTNCTATANGACKGDGVTTTFKFTLNLAGYIPGTLVIHAGAVTATESCTWQDSRQTPPNNYTCRWITGTGISTSGLSLIAPICLSAPNPNTQPWSSACGQVVFAVAPANNQAITFDYQHTPAEFFTVPAAPVGSTIQAFLVNVHSAGAKIGPGTPYVEAINNRMVFCYPYGFCGLSFGVYQVQNDNTTAHNFQYVACTPTLVDGVNQNITIGIHTITCANGVDGSTTAFGGNPTGNAVGNLTKFYAMGGFVLTVDTGTPQEDVQVLDHNTGGCGDPTTTTFCANFREAHTCCGSLTVKGFNMRGVLAGNCNDNNASSSCNNQGGGKYGDANTFSLVQLTRLNEWGQNALQNTGAVMEGQVSPFASSATTGGTTQWPTTDKSQPFKMLLIPQAEVEAKAQTNALGWATVDPACGAQSSYPFAASITFGANKRNGLSAATSFGGNGSITDIYSVNYAAWLCGWIEQSGNIPGGHDNPLILALQIDQTDYFKSVGGSHRTGFSPDAIYNDHIGIMLLTSLTHVSANVPNTYGSPSFSGSVPVALTDNLNHSKDQAVVATLSAKYSGNIAALNAAWGSTYTQFASMDATGTDNLSPSADGVTKTFTATLSHTPDRGSIQIVDPGTGRIIGGDQPEYNGNNYDYWSLIRSFNACTVSVNTQCMQLNSTNTTLLQNPSSAPFSYFCYAAGSGTNKPTCTTPNTLVLNFSVAPNAGGGPNPPISVNYFYGGQGNCAPNCGLADEDGTFGVGWIGQGGTISPSDITKDGNTAFRADMDLVARTYYDKYGTVINTTIHAQLRHTLIFSQYAVGNHQIAGDPNVYLGICPHVDIIGLATNYTWSMLPNDSTIAQVPQQELIDTYCHNKIQLRWIGQWTNNDSELKTNQPFNPLFSITQAERGNLFHRNLFESATNKLATSHMTTNGGWNLWEWQNLYSALPRQAWGLVDFADNVQDGVHNCNTNATATETIGNTPYQNLPTTGCYGNVLTGIVDAVFRNENDLIRSVVPTATRNVGIPSSMH